MAALNLEYRSSVETIEIKQPENNENMLFRVHGDYSWKLFIDGKVIEKIDSSMPLWYSAQGKHNIELHRLGMKFEFAVDVTGKIVIDLFMGLFVKKAVISHFTVKYIEPETILKVQVLGVRTAANTKFGVVVDTHYNFGVYSLMVTYSTGKRQVVECQSDSETFRTLLPFIDKDT